jgi:ferredoxin
VSQRTPVEKTVLVLGGAPEADLVVQELDALGYTIHQVAAEPLKGAVSGAAVSGDGVSGDGVSRYADVGVVALTGQVGDFRLSVLDEAGQLLEIGPASAIVVATGNERYYDTGIPLSPTVLTVSQLMARLDEGVGLGAPYRNMTVGILLDWGKGPASTPPETAAEALRAAIRLRQEWHCEVVLFYRDLRVDSPGFEALTREMRQEGILFSRYGDDGQGARIDLGDDQTIVTTIEGDLPVDLLALPEAVRPRADTTTLAQALKVDLGEDGYFADVNIHQVRSGISNRRGIFYAGRCYMQCTLPDALADALQAAAHVDALLAPGYLEPEEVIAYVDSAECIRCLTCVRSCPHAAVEVREYTVSGANVVAALVAELACQGCGACVSNCPVRAIELVDSAAPDGRGRRPLPAWMQGVNAVGHQATV